MRTRAERRHNDWKKASRKRKIAREIYSSYHEGAWEYYNNLHQYSKNKIHCSCPLCASKTNRKRKNWYGVSYNPPIRDLKQIEKLNYSIIND
jgi:hypothetical protein